MAQTQPAFALSNRRRRGVRLAPLEAGPGLGPLPGVDQQDAGLGASTTQLPPGRLTEDE
jgi:hypothetical protein